MRFKVISKIEKIKQLSNWNSWFAWRPVKIDEESVWVWFETIERRLYYTSREIGIQTFSSYKWMYRTKQIEHGEVY